MSHILLHKRTARSIETFLQNPSHAVALVAPTGCGKSVIARYIAQKLLDISNEQLDTYAYFRTIQPVNDVIPVEQARNIVHYLTLKTTGTQRVRRVLVIEDAHLMTIEAQNTLLKSIEEPPADTILVLTISDKTSVLSTVLSRVQHIQITSPIEQDIIKYFTDQGYDTALVRKAYMLSGGMVGLTTALLNDSKNHPVIMAIEQAKELLQMDCYSRLAQVDKLSKQKQLGTLLFAFSQIAQSGITASAKNNNPNSLEKWHKILSETQIAQTMVAANGQTKLVLTNFFVRM